VQVNAPERTLTQSDYARIHQLLQQQPPPAGAEALEDLLAASELVAPPSVPGTLVTMDTQVLLQDPASDAPPYLLTLCYPEHAEPGAGRVSVLSPVGSSLLGLSAGETAHWRLPGGQARRARIVAVLFQPEARREQGR
jgi:regulator of nucleoside diphosphate kinase